MAKVKVTLIKSVIGTPATQRRTVRSLGLGKLQSAVEHSATPSILGQLRKVAHLVRIEEVPETVEA